MATNQPSRHQAQTTSAGILLSYERLVMWILCRCLARHSAFRTAHAAQDQYVCTRVLCLMQGRLWTVSGHTNLEHSTHRFLASIKRAFSTKLRCIPIFLVPSKTSANGNAHDKLYGPNGIALLQESISSRFDTRAVCAPGPE